MQVTGFFNLPFQAVYSLHGQYGAAILAAFAIAYHQFLHAEIHILDAQAATFHEPQPCSVQKGCHQAVGVLHMIDNGQCLGMAEYHGNPALATGWLVLKLPYLGLQELPIQENQCIQSHGLCAG